MKDNMKLDREVFINLLAQLNEFMDSYDGDGICHSCSYASYDGHREGCKYKAALEAAKRELGINEN